MSETNRTPASAELPEVLTTIKASALLNRAPQTLRKWACLDSGPLRPIRINGRLAWKVFDIQVLLNGGVCERNKSLQISQKDSFIRGAEGI